MRISSLDSLSHSAFDMDLASAHPTESKHSDPPIAYINVRRREPRPPQPPVDPHQSEDEDEDDSGRDEQSTDATVKQGMSYAINTTLHFKRQSHPSFHPRCLCIAYILDDRRSDGVLLNHIQSRFQALLPMLTSPSRTEHTSASVPDSRVYSSGSSRDGNARFARAPSGSGAARNRGSARPAPSSPRDPPERRDSAMTASESSSQDQASQGTQLGTGLPSPGAPYRRPGKHRVGESPSPEEYMALPPEAKKKVDNRLSARRSRAKRKGTYNKFHCLSRELIDCAEHVHILTSQIAEQQNTIEMLRIENKQLNDHIANLSRAGYSLHPPPFQPGLVPHPHPSPHLRHVSGSSHIPAHGRHLPPVSHPALPHLVPSPTLSSRGHPPSSSGLVAAAAPPTGPGHVPILGHNVASRSDTSGSGYAAQGHSGPRYDSPGRGTKREVDDDVDDRLRTRVRYASPERMNWDRESEGRRMSQSGHRVSISLEDLIALI